MIYFTELARDLSGDQSKPEEITFQFYMKELPESIKFQKVTKVNHIEYNGGFHTNQIMGIFPKEIEWEGCFYGTYERAGKKYSAKERATEIEKFMGRPIRVGFSVPTGSDDHVPGVDETAYSKVGEFDGGMNGIVGVYIIEEYDMEIINYVDVNYRIKLTPHMRQGKIKPSAAEVVAVKFDVDVVAKATSNIHRVAGKKFPKPKKNAVTASKLTGRAVDPNAKTTTNPLGEAKRLESAARKAAKTAPKRRG